MRGHDGERIVNEAYYDLSDSEVHVVSSNTESENIANIVRVSSGIVGTCLEPDVWQPWKPNFFFLTQTFVFSYKLCLEAIYGIASTSYDLNILATSVVDS